MYIETLDISPSTVIVIVMAVVVVKVVGYYYDYLKNKKH